MAYKNPYLTNMPWAGGTYSTSLVGPWAGQPMDVQPASNFWVPGNPIAAEDLNYKLNQIENALLYSIGSGLVGITGASGASGTVSTGTIVPITALALSFPGAKAGDIISFNLNATIQATYTTFVTVYGQDTGGTSQVVLGGTQIIGMTGPLGVTGTWTVGAVGGGGAGTTVLTPNIQAISGTGQLYGNLNNFTATWYRPQ